MASVEAQEDLRCRVCLGTEMEELISMFCVTSTQNKLISHMTLACAGVVVSTRDKMSQLICDDCLGNLDVAYACWVRCRKSWGAYTRDTALKPDEEDFRCRICIKQDVDELISLYCICDSQLLKISEMVKQYSGLEVKADDKHPQYICDNCLSELNTGFDFRKQCRRSNATLRRELQLAPGTTSYTPPAKVVSPNANSASSRNSTVKIMPPPINPKKTSVSTNSPSLKTSNKLKVLPPPKQATAKAGNTGKSATLGTPVPPPKIEEVAPFNYSFDTATKKFIPNRKNTTDHKKIPDKPPIKNGDDSLFRKPIPKDKEMVKRLVVVERFPDSKQAPSPKNHAPLQKKEMTVQSKKASPVLNRSSNRAANAPINQPTKSSVATFSTPAEFKKLADSIMSKPKPEHIAKWKKISTSSMLAAGMLKVLKNKNKFTYSQLFSFRCVVCNTRYMLNATRETCIKCKLRFENYADVVSGKNKGSMERYLCNECIFFTVDIKSMLQHVAKHDKKDAPVPSSESGFGKTFRLKPFRQPITSGPVTLTESREAIIPIEIKEEEITVELNTKAASGPDPLSVNATEQAVMQVTMEDSPEKRVRSDEDQEDVVECNSSKKHKTGDDTFDVLLELYDTSSEESFAGFDTIEINDDDDDGEMEELPPTEDEMEQLPLTKGKLRISDSVITVRYKDINTELFDILQDAEDYTVVLLKGAICCGCHQLFTSHEQLQLHRNSEHSKYSSHDGEFDCEVCLTSCKNEQDVEYHRVLTTKKIFYYCKNCQLLITTEEDFESHCEASHVMERPPQVCEPPALPCKMLVSHGFTPRKPLPIDPVMLTTDNESIFDVLKETASYKVLFLKGDLCCGCQMLFDTRAALLDHCEQHHGKGTFPGKNHCHQCQTCYKTEAQLVRHRLQGVKKVYYSCKICRDLLLEKEDDFEMHRYTRHSKLKALRGVTDLNEESELDLLIQKQRDY